MPKVSVTATDAFPYDGISRRKGAKFEAELADAQLLRTIGKVTFQDPAPETSDVPTYERADMRAETPAQPIGRGRHRRRDLTAEV